MDKVSSRTEHGIESKYFDLEYRPSPNHENFNLNLKSSSLLTYLAMADINPSPDIVAKLEEKFLEAFTACQTDEEINNFATFLKKTAEIGGYAISFYEKKSSLITKEGKEMAITQLEQIKEDKQKPVSERKNGQIESKYFTIECNLGNSNLNTKGSSLLRFLAMADVKRDQKSIDKLQEVFLETLVKCQNAEEINNLSHLLYEAAKLGGYAVEFRNTNLSMLNKTSIEDANRKLNEIKEAKKKPVSSTIEHGVESDYFDVKYRPDGGLSELDLACSSIITYMALADATRKQKQIDNLNERFYRALLLCETNLDFINLSTFMNALANTGGYAIEYNEKVKDLINLEGQKKVAQICTESEKKEKADTTELEEFKKEFARLNNLLEALRNNPYKDDEEISYLLRKFNELQSDLYKFTGSIDKVYISECDEQIEAAIDYLKSLYRYLEEIDNLSM